MICQQSSRWQIAKRELEIQLPNPALPGEFSFIYVKETLENVCWSKCALAKHP
jgi:hypothetical protein